MIAFSKFIADETFLRLPFEGCQTLKPRLNREIILLNTCNSISFEKYVLTPRLAGGLFGDHRT